MSEMLPTNDDWRRLIYIDSERGEKIDHYRNTYYYGEREYTQNNFPTFRRAFMA